jgi:hypothetical protein
MNDYVQIPEPRTIRDRWGDREKYYDIIRAYLLLYQNTTV